jgi:hypothetical protein
MVWYGMVWYGMVWYGMVWYGMVWYGMVLLQRRRLGGRCRGPFVRQAVIQYQLSHTSGGMYTDQVQPLKGNFQLIIGL